MALSSDESRKALLGAVSRALDSYERGKLDPLLISALLEQLQVVLEAVAADADREDPRLHEANDVGMVGAAVDRSEGKAAPLLQEGSPAWPASRHVHWLDQSQAWLPQVPPQGSPQQPLLPKQQQQQRPQQSYDDACPVSSTCPAEQRRWQQMEAELVAIQQENMSLHRQVAELHAVVLREQERADAASEAAATAGGPLRLGCGGADMQARSQERCPLELGQPRLSPSEAVKQQQLAESRSELPVVACRGAGGPSRVEAVLMGELEQQRQVAASLRRELQKVVATAARDKEALSQEVRHWQLAADQAASVAESAQQKVAVAEQRLEAQADQVRMQARELGALQQQLTAARASLEQRTSQLERLDTALLQPLLSWHVEVDPAVAPTLVAGMAVTRGLRGSPPGRSGALVRGGGGNALVKIAATVGLAATQQQQQQPAAGPDYAAEHQVNAAVAAFEALRAVAQQAWSSKEQLQASLDAMVDLREALAAERATSELRTSEALRLADSEAQLALQVQELVSELNRVRHESTQAIKATEGEAEQRAAGAFEHGRQVGDRQAAVAVAALRAELQEHERTLHRERELRELALANARREGEIAAAQARKEGEAAAEQARREGAAAAAAKTRRECEAAAEQARLEAEAAMRQARSEWDRAAEEARRHAEAAEEAVRREAAEARGMREAELQRLADEAQSHAGALQEQLQRTEERATEALAKCEHYLKQVYDLTQELKQTRQELQDKDAEVAAAAKEHAAATAKLEAQLCECLQRLTAQAEQLEDYANEHDNERTCSLESLRARLEHVAEERDSLQSECVALRQQLCAVQAAAAGVEVEMDALTSALESHKAARAAAEMAAEEARRGAAAATAAAEEAVARVAMLTQQLQEATLVHEREMHLLEARCTAEIDSAQARYHAELEALQARLKMLRLKQSRVMAYVDDVFMSEEQQQQGQGQQPAQERVQDRDQSPRWGRELHRERPREPPFAAGDWAGQESCWGWQQPPRVGAMPEDEVA